jgi:hypothetical protein
VKMIESGLQLSEYQAGINEKILQIFEKCKLKLKYILLSFQARKAFTVYLQVTLNCLFIYFYYYGSCTAGCGITGCRTSGCGYNWVAANLLRLQGVRATSGCGLQVGAGYKWLRLQLGGA